MSVLINTTGIVKDSWKIFDGDASGIIAADKCLLPVGELLAQGGVWINHAKQVGVVLTPVDDPTSLTPYLTRLTLVAIHFTALTDGRGYSQARLLRQRVGYTGDLRAVGQIGADQVLPLTRCGFTEFELADEQTAVTALQLITLHTPAYQSAVVNTNIVPLPGIDRARALTA
ncbi:MAG: DUF934 domain-containing protein [Burkholderiaceae bacterium]